MEQSPAVLKVEERVGNSISTKGMGYGYAAGVGVLVLCALLVQRMGQSEFSMKLSCTLAGIWWLVFTYLPLRNLQSRPGPPLPKGANAVAYSWRQMIHTLCCASELSQAFKFLLAWFFLSDGLTTMVSVSVIYGKAELKMPQSELALAALLTPLAAFVGAHLWLRIQQLLHLSTKGMMGLLAGLYVLLPLYGVLGFVAPIGLKQVWEVWMVCVYHGLLLGAVQSYARVMFAELLPAGREAQFFGLYSITDKGSAWIGPLVTALLAEYTHELRWGFVYLLVVMAVPVWLVIHVDVAQGRREAAAWAEREQKRAQAGAVQMYQA